MAIIKLSATERRRASVFITCLLLAIAAWIMVKLSNTYNYNVKAVLTYRNAPQRRAFHALQSDTVSITQKATGWQIISSKLKRDNRTLRIDLKRLEYDSHVVLSSQLPTINANRAADNKIIAFSPDTLYFDFMHRSVRRVPVQLVKSIQYQQQFGQSGNIVLKPAYITITGPTNRINKITAWRTDSLVMTDVSEKISARINLVSSTEGNVAIYPKVVEVKVPVEEFTEKTVLLPVKLVGNLDFYNVKIFPQRVKVTFTTSLSSFADVDVPLFEAQADLHLWRAYNYTSLPVKVTRLPAFCKVVSIEPRNVDFIIKK
ncbi:CdaR family protein [Mucilaginibacter antarcticus]|uniref:CdaR family protein n=1 Tax=Mucilaginibacter antarcticus TaxID=1855725 RepID=A0ABW5XN23_9SPHI